MFRIVFLAGLLCSLAVMAQDEKIILTVTAKTANQLALPLSEAKIAGMKQVKMMVQTPWYATPQEFEGPLLRDVLKLAGIKDGNIRVTALNDYAIVMPVSDAYKYDVIVARKRNGKLLTVRNKGPLFLMYPFSQHKELVSTEYFRRSSWQLSSIKAE